MKYSFTLLALTLFFTVSKASDKDPVFKIILSKGFITKVVIDDKENLANLEKVFYSDSLSTGFHSIKVYSKNKKSSSCKGKLIYENNIGVKKGFNTLILIKDKRNAKVMSINIPGYKFNDKVEGGTYDDTRSQPINGRAFANLKTSISESKNDNEKVLIVKDAIKNNFFLVSQVVPVLDLISASNRLELAKMFYVITLDRENFGDVVSLIKNEVDRKELEKFIALY